MPVPHGQRVLARPIDAEVDRGLGRRRSVAFENAPLQIHDQNLVRRQTCTAGITRLNEHAVGIRNASAEMAAVIQKIGHDHHAR